ncbi:hypothetical protein, partial [Paenibacillus mucilaginosus]|uniref:hypothetical protein n=1 Tax=Paenibacillus mucilaginosus TaxID=61624 RepID=UPI003D214A48
EMTQLYVKKSTASSIFLKGCAFFRRTFSVASCDAGGFLIPAFPETEKSGPGMIAFQVPLYEQK